MSSSSHHSHFKMEVSREGATKANHIFMFKHHSYFVCEKSDGIRYLLYLTEDEGGSEVHYLIDRKNDYWFINSGNLHFPTPTSEQSFHKATLLDGELVVDDLGGGRREPRYLVFDCLVMDGQVLMSRELSKRLGYFQEQIFRPYKDLLKKYPEERQFQPFFVEMKNMQVAYGIQMMFEDVIKNLRHGNDGLIFTCLRSEYKAGTDPHILKWKEADENTIDFMWKLRFPVAEPNGRERADGGGIPAEPFVDYDSVPAVDLLAYHGNSGPDAYQYYAPLHLEEAEWEVLKALGDPLDERVVEVYMDEQKRWRLSRFRDDKTDGNHISVVNSVIDSIRDGVTKEDLLIAAKGIRDNWKAREQARRR